MRLLGDDVVAIESVEIDPYAGYKAAVCELAAGAVRVSDRFHIERLAAQAVTDCRCRLQQALTGHGGRKGDPLHAVRRDLIRGRERLTDRGQARLAAAFGADRTDELECACTLKEMLHDVYDVDSRDDGEAALEDWHRWASTYDIAETNRLAKSLRAWEPEVLAFFDIRLTNGRTEGRNLIVKQVKRQGFGYRNPLKRGEPLCQRDGERVGESLSVLARTHHPNAARRQGAQMPDGTVVAPGEGNDAVVSDLAFR